MATTVRSVLIITRGTAAEYFIPPPPPLYMLYYAPLLPLQQICLCTKLKQFSNTPYVIASVVDLTLSILEKDWFEGSLNEDEEHPKLIILLLL